MEKFNDLQYFMYETTQECAEFLEKSVFFHQV